MKPQGAQKGTKPAGEPMIKVLATNRRARHDYHILDSWEVGIVLFGPEVKSLRAGKASLVDAFASFRDGELFLNGMSISQYEQANRWNPPSVAPRKLLMRRAEMHRLASKMDHKALTLVPLRVYLKGSWIKVEIGLAQGKKSYDKRETIKEREHEREMQRAIRDAKKG